MDHHPNTSGYIFLINDSLHCVELYSIAILLVQNDCQDYSELHGTTWDNIAYKADRPNPINFKDGAIHWDGFFQGLSIQPRQIYVKLMHCSLYLLVRDCLACVHVCLWTFPRVAARPCFRIVTNNLVCRVLTKQALLLSSLKRKIVHSVSGYRLLFPESDTVSAMV